MHDFHSIQEQLYAFFDFMTNDKRGSVQNVSLQQKKILLSCSGGLTTSYFAYEMQELLKYHDVQIDAVAYTEIEKIADQYDIILLAPQISYMLPHLKQKYGQKVMAINSKDFATQNFKGILKSITSLD